MPVPYATDKDRRIWVLKMRWERVRSAVLGLPQRFRAVNGYQALDVTMEYLDGECGECEGSDAGGMQVPEPCSYNRHVATLSYVVLAIVWTLAIFYLYPFPNTIPIFIGGLVSLTTWTIINLWQAQRAIWRKETSMDAPASWPTTRRLCLIASTLMLIFFATLGVRPSPEELPVLHQTVPDVAERYFIAANLHDNEHVFPTWSHELLLLSAHLGEQNVFVSIVEGDSKDNTKALLGLFSKQLERRGIPHRIISEDTSTHWWPYKTAPERIGFLAKVRNRALEPISSDNSTIRLLDHDTYTKVIFLNDIYYTYQSIVRLLATRLDGDASLPPDYDLACATDFGWSGLYDNWVARDVCGTPFRAFWPYVKHKPTIKRIKRELPFEVAACWNGAVVFPTGPYLWRPPPKDESLERRGWKMVDNATYPGSRISPPLSLPIRFHESYFDACDHSECFLFSYDLHRLYNGPARRPRIYMNPTVKVAYEANWFRWQTVVLRVPVVRWWLEHWSRGFPFTLVDWIWEFARRKRDYCTWGGLNLPADCPALPGPQGDP